MLNDLGKNTGVEAAKTIADAAENVAQQAAGALDRTTATLKGINDTDIAALADLGSQILATLSRFGGAKIDHSLWFEDGKLRNSWQVSVPVYDAGDSVQTKKDNV